MSLNCLTCGHVLQREDSEGEYLPEKACGGKVRKQVDRSWSGNLSSPQCERGGAVAKIKKEHRRSHSAVNVGFAGGSEPRLVRSSGMRRDWSFEDLSETQDKRVRCH